MILRTKDLVFFILVINACLTKFTVADDSDDSDDDRLQQALVLVDILKSEYIKALNENAMLRENANSASEELSTCAATEEGNFSLSGSSIDPNLTTTMSTTNNTTVLTSSSLSPLTDSYPRPIVTAVPKLPTYHEPQTLLPYYQQGSAILTREPSQNLPPVIPTAAPHFYGMTWPPNYPTPYADGHLMPYRPYRRMLPRDYYYFDNPMYRYDNIRMGNLPFHRRMQNRGKHYEMKDAPNAAKKENETQINSSTVTTQPTFSPTTRFLVNKSTTRSLVNKSRVQNYDQFKTTFQTKKVQTEQPKKRWRNPILNQVADELIKEIGVTRSSNKNTSHLKKRHRYKKLQLHSTSEKNMRKKLDHRLFTKTTLRIHMGRSTRLALPLSENNAYCFFSPKSALCRSSI